MGFKDKSWCHWGVNGLCKNTTCVNTLTPALREEAIKWWGNNQFPIVVADLQTEDCGVKL